MTDNEIIKALECCGDESNCNDCPCCDKRFQYETSCAEQLMKAAAELIKRKNAQINKLNYENLQLIKSIKYLRSEAYKEFADRVKLEDCTRFIEEYYLNGEMYSRFRGGLFSDFIDDLLAELTHHKETVSMIDGHIEE